MTWLVLRYWYGYHRAKFQKWQDRKCRWDKKRWKLRRNRVRRESRIYRKYEHHRFWFSHYCELVDAFGHQIDCIHFGKGENTIQSGCCPYRENICETCKGHIYLSPAGKPSPDWKHYLSYEDDGFTPRTHAPVPREVSA